VLRLYVRVRGVSSVVGVFRQRSRSFTCALKNVIIQAALLRFGSGWHVVEEADWGKCLKRHGRGGVCWDSAHDFLFSLVSA